MLEKEEFDLWAAGYDKDVQSSDEQGTYPFAGYASLLKTIYTRVIGIDAKNVLDLGFGTGTLLRNFANTGISLYGVDFSDEMKKSAEGTIPGAKLYTFDLRDGLPSELDDLTFDAITATYSLHHLSFEEKIRLIRDLRPRLTEHGRIFIGDIAFRSADELDACRLRSGEDWDSEESYFIHDELTSVFPDLTFEPFSDCAALMTLDRTDTSVRLNPDGSINAETILDLACTVAYRKENLRLSREEGGAWAYMRLSPDYRPLLSSALQAYTEGTVFVPDASLALRLAFEAQKEGSLSSDPSSTHNPNSFDTSFTVTERLLALADHEYADFQAKLTPTISRESCIGVRVPVLRKLAKEYAKDPECEAFLTSLPHVYYDENMLHAQLLSGMKDYDTCLAGVESFLPFIDNWAVCDTLSPKVFAKHKPELLMYIRKWIASKHPYTCRFGIGMLMAHYLDEDFDPSYLELPACVRSDDYYVNMMIAWYFATALAKQWDATIPYLEQSRLSPWAHAKTIQKAKESYRITKEQKVYLQSLK